MTSGQASVTDRDSSQSHDTFDEEKGGVCAGGEAPESTVVSENLVHVENVEVFGGSGLAAPAPQAQRPPSIGRLIGRSAPRYLTKPSEPHDSEGWPLPRWGDPWGTGEPSEKVRGYFPGSRPGFSVHRTTRQCAPGLWLTRPSQRGTGPGQSRWAGRVRIQFTTRSHSRVPFTFLPIRRF